MAAHFTGVFEHAFEQLNPEQQQTILSELKRLARHYLLKERANHTLQTTELVNEAYANLAGKAVLIENKHHFMVIAARQMRRILVDHARKKMATKRDFKPITMTLSALSENDSSLSDTVELIHIDKLLTELGEVDKRSSQVMELKLFSSLQNSEIAKLIGVSLATAERDLKAAKAWIRTEMAEQN